MGEEDKAEKTMMDAFQVSKGKRVRTLMYPFVIPYFIYLLDVIKNSFKIHGVQTSHVLVIALPL
jgi:hypothetical protein